MFVGEEVPEGAMQVAGAAAFLADPFDFAQVNHGIREIIKLYRRLEEGQVVYENQILAMVDTAKSLGDMEMKHSKVVSARADYDGAKAIAEEAESKAKTAEELYAKHSISEEYPLRQTDAGQDVLGQRCQIRGPWYDANGRKSQPHRV